MRIINVNTASEFLSEKILTTYFDRQSKINYKTFVGRQNSERIENVILLKKYILFFQ